MCHATHKSKLAGGGAGRSPDETAAGIRKVLHTLQGMWPHTEFVLMAMLPRADDLYRDQMVRLYSGGKVANRDTKVWHGATENGP
jgi:hypothetical protein